jgi:opacity protein-like surface antigen
MLDQRMKKFFLMPAIFMIAGISFAQAQSIKALTSKDAVEEAKNAPAAPRIDSSVVNKHSVGLGIGQTFLLGDFEDNGEDKITGDILYNYSASHSFDLLVDLHSSKHKYQGRYVRLSGISFGIKAKFYNFDNFSPFVIGGLGFYSPKVKRVLNGVLVESESKTVLGTNLGVGIELRLNRHVAMGVTLQLHNPFDVKQDIGPEVEGNYSKLLIYGLYTF